MANETTLEEKNAWEMWNTNRDTDACNTLIKKYMPLVSFHVQRISVGLPKSVSREELNSLGMIGLYDALERFDPKRDLKFDTYASFRIRGSIIDGLRKEDWLSRGTREKTKKIEATIEKLEQKMMRNVTVQEIADDLDLSTDEVYSTMNEHFFANVLSIDEQLNESDEKEGPTFAIRDDKTEIPEEKVMKDELIQEMASMIETLNDKEQLVLSLFYKEELTLTEIGQVMNLSTSRISQIHSKAIYKLRHSLEKVI
ncbi:FliA/WhiG family RNA polymerase sigma factor [Niallia taxi]|uniref:FliA/WhiG family RNA polymerase sigma factor n=1 Tax=Niallia taxi TaxID=2499688 RepID=A0A437KFN9_9BACI|nr:FliA/WhiG family RNA polymerase sigma factor [Niallia taxi]MDK8638623.1 FliA/WhiG family RNA polymerase sigma factor [Niallia taxi]MED4037839.1 FliA/WhiG family RNA polymerase sigma factor [Niallia taxi]MED4053755.1 FliA/WhiG family RNA polymerase sigma factor [Niallia taxi]MED4119595.1 FliA/WhiG family RNA polymerase sigma factor [Niallia taxi]RVT67077.1 FliA/WhiG family RNA polymerase sigma factor [Niallia taxi]